VNQFNATGSYNLAELNQQIAQIINLNGRSFAGTGKLEAFVVFDSNGVIHGGGNIVTENLSAVVLPNTLPIQDAKLEMGFAGNVTIGANFHARISVLRVNGDSIQFVANSPIDLALAPAGTQISAPALHLATQSAQWNPLLVAMKILPKDTAIAGAIDLTAAVDLNSDRAVTASTLTLKQLQITSGSTRTPASNVTITLAGTADLKAKTFTLDPAKDDLKISELDPQTGAGNTLTIAKGGKISWGAAPMDVILSTSYSLDRIALFLKAISPTFAHTLAGNGKTTLHLTGTLDGSISFDGDTQNPLIACDNLLPPNFDFGGPLSGTVTTKPYFTLNAKSLNLVGNRKQLTLAITKGATFATPPAGMQFSADGLNVDVAALDTWNPTLYTLQKLPATSALKGHATITGSIVYDPAAIRSAMTANVAGFQQLSKNAAGQWASTLPSTDIIAALNVSLNLPNSTATFTDTSRIEEHDPTTKAGNSVTIAKGSILTWATGKEENASLVLAYDLARVSALLKPWLPAQLTNMTGQRTLAATTLTGRIIDSPDALKKYSQVQLSNLPIGFDQIVFGGFTLGKGEQPLALTNGVLNLAGAPIPLNSGTLNLGGRVDLNEPTPAYIVDKPVNLLQAIQINQKIAADQLFFLPFSWSGGQGLVGITGKLDLTILDANFPLSADNIKTAGTLHGNLGITGLNANFPLLSALLSAAGPLLKISQSDYGIHDFNIPNIAITLEKGRITYSNLVLKAGTVTLTFSGSVGLDNTLDMNIALAEPRLPLVIPIHMAGTISAPKLDLKLTAADLLKLNTGGAETGDGNALENLGGFLNPGKTPPSPPPSTTPSAPRGTPRPSITRPTTTAPTTRAATSPTTRPTTATFPATQTKPTDLVK
jgi:hypothetical protein